MPSFSGSFTPTPVRPPALARFVVALAACGAIQALARSQAHPAGAAESVYLALLVGGVLAAIAALAPRPGRETLGTALLAVAGTWIVGHGPHRGALVALILVVGLTVAAARATRSSPAGVLAAPGRTIALAVGLQMLARGDLLLPPLLDPRTLVSLLALPAVTGVALHVLARSFDATPVWVAGGAVYVLSPGWNVTTTLALAALAAGTLVADAELPAKLRIAAGVALVVPPLWDPGLGLLFTLGGLTFVIREARASWLVSTAGITVLVYTPFARTGDELAEFWATLLLLLPAALAARRDRRAFVLRGAFYGLVAAVVGQGPEALAGGAALIALAVPAESAVATLQRVWTNTLVLAVTLLAAYPWLRENTWSEALELVGITTLGTAMILIPGLVVGLALLAEVAARRLGRAPGGEMGGRSLAGWTTAVFAVVIAAAVLRAMPVTVVVPIAFEPVTLDADQPDTRHRFPATTISGGVIDTHLIHGENLPFATPVAEVRLRREGEILGRFELLAGLDTADWAAARPDIAARPGFRAPDAWLSRLAPAGTFFAERFRSRFRLPEATAATSLVVRRHKELPADVEIVIYRLELRR